MLRSSAILGEVALSLWSLSVTLASAATSGSAGMRGVWSSAAGSQSCGAQNGQTNWDVQLEFTECNLLAEKCATFAYPGKSCQGELLLASTTPNCSSSFCTFAYNEVYKSSGCQSGRPQVEVRHAIDGSSATWTWKADDVTAAMLCPLEQKALSISGSFVLELAAANAASIKANLQSFKALFAKSWARSTGVADGDVTITQIYVDNVAQLRRLQEGDIPKSTVKVDYKVVTTLTSHPVNKNFIDADSLKTQIEAQAKETGFEMVVSLKSVTHPTKQIVDIPAAPKAMPAPAAGESNDGGNDAIVLGAAIGGSVAVLTCFAAVVYCKFCRKGDHARMSG